MRTNLPVTDQEYLLADGKTIVSTTDLQGNITYANPYFIEVSGFSEQELIGAPQNVLRHPDMPVEAYADLWTTIRSGLPWCGMVKNRCANGDFYWVLANVTPVVENGVATGYISVRTKPTREQVSKASRLYKEVKSGNPNKIAIKQGRTVNTGWRSKIVDLKNISLAQRIAINMSLIAILSGALCVVALLKNSTPLLAAGSAIVAAFSLYFWYSLQNAIVQPLRLVTATAKILAGGDLTSKLEATRHDDVGQLLLLMRQLNINLASIIGDIRGNFEQIVSSTQEVSAGNMNLQMRTEAQASNLEQTSASMEELNSTVENNAINASEANRLATGVTVLAEKTGIAVSEVVTAMNEINSSSRKIVDIIGLIDGIAFQTNILALNAAVEAARAGEQGRGFAVVATEVRNLAQRSAAAAKDIKGLIDISVGKVESGAALADQAGRNMFDVIAAIKQVAGIISEISSATKEQSAGIGQVKDAILQMDDVTQQNAAMVEQAAASANVLTDQAFAVSNALQVFKLIGSAQDNHQKCRQGRTFLIR